MRDLRGGEEWSVIESIGALYPYIRKETSVVLGMAPKPNSMPPVTYLQCSINSEQPDSMVLDRSLLLPYRLLIKNIFYKKCSWDDHKIMLRGLHGRGIVHSTGVRAPMIPGGRVIHHQQKCRAQ